MSQNSSRGLSIHPYIGGSARNLIGNAIKHGGIDRRHLPTFLATLLGTGLTAPLRLYEQLRHSGPIRRTRLREDPIFIIGHWRSGTTHLHNIVSQDPRFGYLTTLQAVFPTCAVTLGRNAALKRKVAGLIPEKRMMDNVRMGLDLPQEEEFSLSCLTRHSHHCNHFPRTIARSFDEYVLFETSEKNKARWKSTYLQVVKKAAYIAGGKRLVLKNPYNTARIGVLLELFPNAKFIHIHRNPYNIYVSALHDFVKEAEEMALQDFSEEMFAEICFVLYEKLMTAYWRQKDLVPAGNLAEVAYEKLETDPMTEIERIYDELGLGRDPAHLRPIEDYLNSIRDYRKNRYSYSAKLARTIGERWRFALDRMGYALPPDIELSDVRDWTCRMEA